MFIKEMLLSCTEPEECGSRSRARLYSPFFPALAAAILKTVQVIQSLMHFLSCFTISNLACYLLESFFCSLYILGFS